MSRRHYAEEPLDRSRANPQPFGTSASLRGVHPACGRRIADFYPLGNERSPIANNCTTSQHYLFTGKERDSESGLDNFGARYYSSGSSLTGRFLSPDWAARATTVPYAVFGDPQSLNLYGYVRDDPVSQADLDGHQSEAQKTQTKLQCSSTASAAACGKAQQQSTGDTLKSLGQAIAKDYTKVAAAMNSFANSPVAMVMGGGEEGATEEGLKLAKSFASDAQVAGEAKAAVAGAAAEGGKVLRQAARLAREYGGEPGEWSKMTSGAYRAADGSVISTHWYQVLGSEIKYEIKTIIDNAPWNR